MTGMTRFASFWVEDGQIVAPLSVMRFDDSIFNMFGDQLQGLTSRSETFHEAHTYSSRNTSAMQIPGALIDGLTFTL
jgi:predicted Zn-dependent protease